MWAGFSPGRNDGDGAGVFRAQAFGRYAIDKLAADSRVSISIGDVELNDDGTLDQLIGRAEAALYLAKQRGGSRVEVTIAQK